MALNKFFVNGNLTLHDFLELSNGDVMNLRPRIFCKDGFNFSLQASSFHYCSPRSNGLTSYDEYEIGFPSHGDSLLEKYAEDARKCRKTVYGNVPEQVVEELLRKHGGIKYYSID